MRKQTALWCAIGLGLTQVIGCTRTVEPKPMKSPAERPVAPPQPVVQTTPLPAAENTTVREDGLLTVAGLVFTVPPEWIRERPTGSMRLAQYQLPGTGGPAELVVFNFGIGQGGAIQANIDRWAGQFSDEQGNPVTAETSTLNVEALTVTVVRAQGTMTATAMGPMAPAPEPRAGYALYGLIVEGGPQGNVFVKITGPKQTVQEQLAALEAFTHSVRLDQ